jgi:hypothetical protein
MSKLKAIKAILLASNYIVITDNSNIGSVSPLYADKFVKKLAEADERQRLAIYKYHKVLDDIADKELGELS